MILAATLVSCGGNGRDQDTIPRSQEGTGKSAPTRDAAQDKRRLRTASLRFEPINTNDVPDDVTYGPAGFAGLFSVNGHEVGISTDGTSWQRVRLELGRDAVADIGTAPDGSYLVVGGGADGLFLLNSHDGVNWTPVDVERPHQPVPSYGRFTTVGENRLLLIGQKITGDTAAEIDPVVWLSDTGRPQDLRLVHDGSLPGGPGAHDVEIVAAVGDDEAIAIVTVSPAASVSTDHAFLTRDGRTWTEVPLPRLTTSFTENDDFVFSDGTLLAVAQDVLYASDGDIQGSWSEILGYSACQCSVLDVVAAPDMLLAVVSTGRQQSLLRAERHE